MELNELGKIIEETGINCNVSENEYGFQATLSWFSPLGQDVNIEIPFSDTDNLVQNILDYPFFQETDDTIASIGWSGPGINGNMNINLADAYDGRHFTIQELLIDADSKKSTWERMIENIGHEIDRNIYQSNEKELSHELRI